MEAEERKTELFLVKEGEKEWPYLLVFDSLRAGTCPPYKLYKSLEMVQEIKFALESMNLKPELYLCLGDGCVRRLNKEHYELINKDLEKFKKQSGVE